MQMPKDSAQNAGPASVKPTAHQSVYAHLRDWILFGELAPGQPVTIQGLTKDLQAGMTPVREAIRRLISDGALTMNGNRRVSVPTLSKTCVDELEFMRKTLEPRLARRAVSQTTPALLADLRNRDDALNAAIARGDIRAYLKQNYRFHETLYAAAGAPIISETVDRLWLRFGPSLRVVCGRYGTLNLPDKHADLLAALETGNEDAAEHALREDVDQGMIQIRESLQSTAS